MTYRIRDASGQMEHGFRTRDALKKAGWMIAAIILTGALAITLRTSMGITRPDARLIVWIPQPLPPHGLLAAAAFAQNSLDHGVRGAMEQPTELMP